jgi:hypothetical protein
MIYFILGFVSAVATIVIATYVYFRVADWADENNEWFWNAKWRHWDHFPKQ